MGYLVNLKVINIRVGVRGHHLETTNVHIIYIRDNQFWSE